MEKKSFWIGFGIGCLLCVVSLVFIAKKVLVQPDISLSQIEVYNLKGEKDDLKNYIGKPLVVNFWATWCAPCRKEMPSFEEVKKEMGNDVNFVLISDEDSDKIMKFSNSKPFTFTYLRSEKKLSDYGINARPTTYFFNAKGELVTKNTSDLDSKSLRELIAKIK
ncbi:TlpA family protein disulfide reductase [Flavobacterium pedocola]